MKPKGKLFALLVVFTAIGLVTATGAFTSVTAERTVSVSVDGDSAALLQLTAAYNANGQEYASNDSASLDTLQIDISSPGVNPDAVTQLGSVFRITNQGTQEVSISLTKLGTGSNEDAVTFYEGNNTADNSFSNLATGESVLVGLEVDTTGLDSSATITVNVEISASSTAT